MRPIYRSVSFDDDDAHDDDDDDEDDCDDYDGQALQCFDTGGGAEGLSPICIFGRICDDDFVDCIDDVDVVMVVQTLDNLIKWMQRK